MSDETPTEPWNPSDGDVPTQRMDQADGDAPTQRMDQNDGDAQSLDPEAVGGSVPPDGDGIVASHVPIAGAAPTERFPQATGPLDPLADGSATAPVPVEDERRSRRNIIVLSAIGVALLFALIILLIFLLNRGDGPPVAAPTSTSTASASPTPSATPTASETPSPTPTATEEPPPPPPSTAAVINNFASTNNTVTCNASAPMGDAPQYIGFSWSSSNVDQVFFGVDTNDASAAPLFDNLPPSGDTSDFPAGYNPFEYACFNPSHTYTLTVIGSGGDKVSQTVTITNEGDTQ